MSFNASVAFQSEISDTPAFSDVTPWVKAFSTNRGRSFELDQFETGTIAMTLDNSDGRFTPERVSSAGFEQYQANVINPSDASLFAVANGVTLSTFTLSDTKKSALKVAIPALDGWGYSIVSLPIMTVAPSTRLIASYKWRKLSSSDATVSLQSNLDFMNANGIVLRSHPAYHSVNINSDTASSTVSLSCEIPADVYKVRVRFSLHATGTSATNVVLEECHFNNDDPYVFNMRTTDYDYESMVRPNRRVKVHSVMGGNLLPRWVASPVQGEDSYGPNGRFERTNGPNGETWWTYSFQRVTNPPTSDAGTTSFRVKMAKATAIAVTGTAVGVTGFYVQSPVYANRAYRVRFWARADTSVGIPPSGTFRVEMFDRANNSNVWNVTSIPWAPTDGAWFRVDQVLYVPCDFASVEMRITNHFGDTVLSQNVASDYAIEFMGLQVQEVTYNSNPLDYVYGDGAEPVFNGYAERWSSAVYSPYGNQEVELTASDDFRVFSDAIFPNPIKAGYLGDPDLCMYTPFDDPAGTADIVDGWDSTLGSGAKLSSNDGGSTITFGVTGFVGGEDDGTCVQFSAPSETGFGSWFRATGNPEQVTDPAWKSDRELPDTGFQLNFWFKIPAGSRPANNTHYAVFAASRYSDGASTHLVSLYGDANGDYVYTRWGTIGNGYLAQKTRGALFDGNPHFVTIQGGALADSFNGGRSVSVYIDGTFIGATTTAKGAAAIPQDHYIGGSYDDAFDLNRWQFVGFLSHVSLSSSNAASITDKWNARKWGQSPAKTGSFTMGYVARNVNATRYGSFAGDGGTTNYGIYPASFTNASALNVLQDLAKDLRGFVYANRDGGVTWYNRVTVNSLLNATPKVGNSAVLDFSQGEGPEPGWSYETDITRVYNQISGTHVYSGQVYSAVDTDSIERYGRRSYTFESTTSQASTVSTQVSDMLGNDDGYSSPRVQLSDISWSMTPNYQTAAKILRLDLLGIVTLSNLPDFAPWDTAYLQVEKIAHTVTVDGDICAWNTTISVFNVGAPVNHNWNKPLTSWY